jgi:hypothetical protein
MSFCFPIRAPIIETTIESTHPPQIGIHIGIPGRLSGGGFQKFSSTIAEKIRNALIIRGTYQMLFGFCFIMKKQAVADNSPNKE